MNKNIINLKIYFPVRFLFFMEENSKIVIV